MTTTVANGFPAAVGAEVVGIRCVAVIGAGSMGAGIAAQFANAGIPVHLLDRAGKDGARNSIAEAGIGRQIKAGDRIDRERENQFGTLSLQARN